MRYDAAFDNVITETGIKPEAYLGNSRKCPVKEVITLSQSSAD